jgi:RNA polymerase sigma-70 factor (ECF subfamily)
MISLAEPQPTETHPSVDLSKLLASAAQGDAASWKYLVQLYSRRVFALARSRCSSPELAEEITQSVFVTVATKLSSGQYSEQGKFEPWLFRVAMNRIRDEARRKNRQAVPTDSDTLSDMPGVSDSRVSEDQEQAQLEVTALRRAMRELSDQDREVIELRHHGQMNFKDMCELLNEPLGTLLARHHRALRKLKELIEQNLGTGTHPSQGPSQRDMT